MSSLTAAVHVALAAAIGAFGLAIGALIHGLSGPDTGQRHRLLLIALVAWLVVTALPAFLVTIVLSFLCRIVRRKLTNPNQSVQL